MAQSGFNAWGRRIINSLKAKEIGFYIPYKCPVEVILNGSQWKDIFWYDAYQRVFHDNTKKQRDLEPKLTSMLKDAGISKSECVAIHIMFQSFFPYCNMINHARTYMVRKPIEKIMNYGFSSCKSFDHGRVVENDPEIIEDMRRFFNVQMI